MNNLLPSLKLNGFEKLRGEMTGLAQINLLIGANGSGKSSVFRLLTTFGKSRLPMDAPYKDSEAAQALKGLNANVVLINPPIQTSFDFPLFSAVADLFENCSVEEQIVEVPFEKKTFAFESVGVTRTKTHTVAGVKTTDLSTTAPAGWSRLSRIFGLVSKELTKQANIADSAKSQLTLLCIEEPENGLHPSVQKKFLQRLKMMLSKSDVPVQCFISTHSPYLVRSSAELENTKIYLFDNCNLCDLQGKSFANEPSNGYSSNQALVAAHYLLGSGIDDFVPKMVFCENSVCTLLQAIAKKGGPEVPVFIQTVGGDLDAINYVNGFSTLFATLVVLSKGSAPTSLFLPPTISAVVDGPLDGPTQRQLKKLQQKRELNVFTIGVTAELEANYPTRLVDNFFDQNFGKVKTDFSITKSFGVEYDCKPCSTQNKASWVGTKKAELARWVVQKADEQEFLHLRDLASELYKKL
jgi:ABC-type branched-subunit amino acid transport system ATPase component